MNKYSDLQATNLRLDIELETVGSPAFDLSIIPSSVPTQRALPGAFTTVKQTYYLDLLTPFSVIIDLYNKDYNVDNTSAVIIRRLSIDNIELIPDYDYLAHYDNDHDNNNPTSYIGFNGQWRLTFDRPFYHWLHQHTGQGWLLD
jgi:hypothetical protein